MKTKVRESLKYYIVSFFLLPVALILGLLRLAEHLINRITRK